MDQDVLKGTPFAIETELLREKITPAQMPAPLWLEAMSRAAEPSVDRVYRLARGARCWNVSRATVYRHRQGIVKLASAGCLGRRQRVSG